MKNDKLKITLTINKIEFKQNEKHIILLYSYYNEVTIKRKPLLYLLVGIL